MKSASRCSILWVLLCVAVFCVSCDCGDDDDSGGDDDAGDDSGDDTDDDADDDVDDDTGDDSADDDTDDDDTVDDAEDYSVAFDGTTGYAVSGANLSPQLGNAWTVEGWLYFEEYPTFDSVTLIDTTDEPNYLGFILQYESGSKEDRVGGHLNFGYVYAVGSDWSVNTADLPAAGTWFHFAGVYSESAGDGTLCIYIDGIQKECITKTDLFLQGDFPVYIGRHADPSGKFFHGRVNEVRISDIARYSSDFTVSPDPFSPDTNTAALYHFDEGAGTAAQDDTAHHNDLTLNGGCSWALVSE